jgi:hypothetical protein
MSRVNTAHSVDAVEKFKALVYRTNNRRTAQLMLVVPSATVQPRIHIALQRMWA